MMKMDRLKENSHWLLFNLEKTIKIKHKKRMKGVFHEQKMMINNDFRRTLTSENRK